MESSRTAHRAFCGIFVALAAIALNGDTPITARRLAMRRHDPIKIHHVRDGAVSSYNWSGYAVTGGPDSVTDAKGSWVVPAVTCPSSPNQYSSFWVGIDGFNSNSVEQIGTDSDCQNGAPTYYAWFEFYPHPSFLIKSITIHANDVITAEVKYLGRNQFTVSLTDATTGQSFSTTTKVNAQRSSAEWIAEAPSSSGGILPLANFGVADFGQSYASRANTATINRVTLPIGSFGAVSQITMVSQADGTTAKAQPSALSTDNNSFWDTWYSPGP